MLLKKKKKTKKKFQKQKRNNFPIQVRKNLQQVKSQIQKAAIKSGRSKNKITIVAVTKSFSLEIWDIALHHNLTTIGESRIKEAEQKNKKFNKNKKIELHLFFKIILNVFQRGKSLTANQKN